MYLTLTIKYIKLLRIIFLIIILNTYYLIHTTTTVHAEGIALSISPSLIQINAIPQASTKTSLTIKNQGDEALNIKIILKPFQPSKKTDGQIEYPNNNTIPQEYQKIFKKIHITDNGIDTSHFELSPQQKKTLQIQCDIPKDEIPTDYYFSAIFMAQSNKPPKNTDSPEEQNISTLNAGIASNILLSIGDTKKQTQAYIDEFSAPTFIQSGPINFTVRIKNEGIHLIKPKGIIFIKNIFGQTIGRVDLESANILAASSRSLTDTQTGSLSSIPYKIKAIWPENFLLGPYTATLNLAISEKGPIYNKSIIFFALPLRLTIEILVGLTITIIGILRIRYMLKSNK